MPYRRGGKKKSARGRPRKRKGALPTTSRQIVHVPTYMQSLSTQRGKFIRLRYCEYAPLDPGAAGIASAYVWRANGIYDPNYTGAGGQPLGRDELDVLYSKYCVVSSRCRAMFTPRTAASDPPAQVGIALSSSAGLTTTSISTILTQQRTSWAQLPYDKSQTRICTQNFNARSFFNVKDIKDNTSRIGAAMSTNPTDQAFFVVFAGCEGGSDTGAIDVLVVIDYVIYVSEAQNLAAS